jgi:GR25 family glycosyltransferase involved in LPS biosynthesis
MNCELITKIIVINLERCTERKSHIIEEFNKNGITNYEFFNAIDKDSDDVEKLMNTDFVKKFPPCFRCSKNTCDCHNNVLIKPQIGNWLSFINIMKNIVDNKYNGLIMICEDDIKFTSEGPEIINSAIKMNNFGTYNIDINKPILIRLGSIYSRLHIKRPIKLGKRVIMSNPCFLINYHFAVSFINRLDSINTTSDIFIHVKLPNKDKTIQHFTLLPQPIYQLSYGENPTFISEIHPKGINEDDKVRVTQHFKKVHYKKILCIGNPRSGSAFTANCLKQMGLGIEHESMGADGVSSWMLAVNTDKYPFGNVTKINEYYFETVIHYVRNPWDAIPSMILENKYSPNNNSYKFRVRHINSILGLTLEECMSDSVTPLEELELAIKTFIYWNKICEIKKPTIVFQIENIDGLKKFNTSNRIIDTSPKNVAKKYDKPIITNDMYKKVQPELLNELHNFCIKYNYPYILSTDQCQS